MLSAEQPNICLSQGFSCGRTGSSRAWLFWWKKSQPRMPIACCQQSVGSYDSPLMCSSSNRLLQPSPTFKSIHLKFRYKMPGNKYCSPLGTYEEDMASIWVQGKDGSILHQRTLVCIQIHVTCSLFTLQLFIKWEGWWFPFYLL